MTALPPWYELVKPRQELRTQQALNMAEFAVHLDQIVSGQAPLLYRDPVVFFERTFVTRSLHALAAEVVRRLAGSTIESEAVFNLATQFGGGKTHALALLYHLAQGGPAAAGWAGVASILEAAGVAEVPQARTAIFVGQQFDPRGGEDGTPLRRTPWGEVAWQLAGEAGYRLMAPFDEGGYAPGGDTLDRLFTLVGQPILLLLDEVLSYMSRYRGVGRLGDQFYHFLQNLSEAARGRAGVVLAVSIPMSEQEMTAEDVADYNRLEKVLNRLAKPMILSAAGETAEIIRRRLFDWQGLPAGAAPVLEAYQAWAISHRTELPRWFPVDQAQETFAATYPFHPATLSVFERKWQSLPSFQRTRGVLRMLAIWVARTYEEGYQQVLGDPLITLGRAPLDDPLFRTGVISDQMRETRLEAVVTTDITGREGAHAARLDELAPDTLKAAQLHRQVATAIFFESNGGQVSNIEATLPELRLAVGGPGLDIGNVETAAEALRGACYYLRAEGPRYHFALTPNLNKILADREASIPRERLHEQVEATIRDIMGKGGGSPERRYFPEQSGALPNQPVLTLVILAPHYSLREPTTLPLIKRLLNEAGASTRTYKNALVFAVAEQEAPLREAARRLLALEAIRDEEGGRLDEGQRSQLGIALGSARNAMQEAVWQAYKVLVLLDKNNELRQVDMGLLHSSAATSLVQVYLHRLEQEDAVTKAISPNFLTRNWPPAFEAWSTLQVRDAFFASPQFPRLLEPKSALQAVVQRGVQDRHFAYVGQRGDEYAPFFFGDEGDLLAAADVEISAEMFLLPRDMAEAYLARRSDGESAPVVPPPTPEPPPAPTGSATTVNEERATLGTTPQAGAQRLGWEGTIPAQKWMTFYTRVLSKFAVGRTLTLTVRVEVEDPAGIPRQQVDETRLALRELGLSDTLRLEE